VWRSADEAREDTLRYLAGEKCIHPWGSLI
jgi:hypothetical protein